MEYCAEFGKRLREARLNANKSQRDLAEAAGISPQMVSAYEKQERKPSIEVAAALAGKLGVSLDYLCGIEAPERPGTVIATIADAINHISELAKYFDCKCAIENKPRPEEEWEVIGTGVHIGTEEVSYQEELITTDPVAVINIEHHLIADFIKRWHEIISLYRKGIISKDLMDSWYLGEMDRLSKIKMVSDTPKQIQWFGIDPIA